MKINKLNQDRIIKGLSALSTIHEQDLQVHAESCQYCEEEINYYCAEGVDYIKESFACQRLIETMKGDIR